VVAARQRTDALFGHAFGDVAHALRATKRIGRARDSGDGRRVARQNDRGVAHHAARHALARGKATTKKAAVVVAVARGLHAREDD